MELKNYELAIQKISERYEERRDKRIAMEAVTEVALHDFLSGGMSEKEYGQLCVITARVAYPEEKEE